MNPDNDNTDFPASEEPSGDANHSATPETRDSLPDHDEAANL